MMKHDTEKRRELRFVCPECGSDWLLTRNESYITVDHVYDDDDLEWGYVKHEEIMDYVCGGCGYVLEFEDEDGLVDWLIAHCDQEASQPAQPDGHDPSAFPYRQWGLASDSQTGRPLSGCQFRERQRKLLDSIFLGRSLSRLRCRAHGEWHWRLHDRLRAIRW